MKKKRPSSDPDYSAIAARLEALSQTDFLIKTRIENFQQTAREGGDSEALREDLGEELASKGFDPFDRMKALTYLEDTARGMVKPVVSRVPQPHKVRLLSYQQSLMTYGLGSRNPTGQFSTAMADRLARKYPAHATASDMSKAAISPPVLTEEICNNPAAMKVIRLFDGQYRLQTTVKHEEIIATFHKQLLRAGLAEDVAKPLVDAYVAYQNSQLGMGGPAAASR